MANYEGIYRSNYFRVTSKKKFENWLESYNQNATLITNGELVGFYNDYEGMDFINQEFDEDDVFQKLQELLVDGEAVILMEIGNEKMRYLSAYTYIITKTDVTYLDLERIAIEKTKKLLDNPLFETQMSY